MDRDYQLEKIIQERIEYCRSRKINHYGGMGMDTATEAERIQRLKELDYMEQHPEVYKTPKCQSND